MYHANYEIFKWVFKYFHRLITTNLNNLFIISIVERFSVVRKPKSAF